MSSFRSSKLRFVALTSSARQIFLLLLLLFVLAACSREQEFNGVAYDPAKAAPALNGTRQDGSAFQIADTKGKVTLLYFGYTQCPDICPLTMAQITSIYRQMGDETDNIRVIFVSTDPERDTPEKLTEYLNRFDVNFWGVQVPLANLAETLKAYGGLAEKDPLAEGNSPDQYTVSHSNWIYAIDKDGNLRLLFSSQLQPQQIIDDLHSLLNE